MQNLIQSIKKILIRKNMRVAGGGDLIFLLLLLGEVREKCHHHRSGWLC
ncbi:hypothetical protein ABT242_001732 [Campylobacter jejuni]|uniref:Uncharacterized protein n=1 Tax=Campylobacter jejuni TaxID=197 RepID=A0A6C7YB25_CAMJU|nr:MULTISPECIES: hypothetical protein [Campylobacter]WPM69814.1 hypothetical protein OT343_06805 [Campylobacter sp. CFSAN122719]EDN6806938.1 hypothetical protein [Campylobacter jejuni]EDO7443291.1 hypothetical protein [Campylobacter jejuni]EDO7569762.1 hypothetical protein [Campylobacter jejuni]EDO8137612.1 hypothetical protein [Campylobacter jejuni]